MLEDLYIYECPAWILEWEDNIENELWLELLHPFTVAKNLHLCDKFAPRIAPALQVLAEGKSTRVLPTEARDARVSSGKLGSSQEVRRGENNHSLIA